MNDLFIYYPTKGGYVVGKSARAEHSNMEKMPDYRPEENLVFLPILDPKKTSTKAIQVESSTSQSQASIIVDPNEVINSENETLSVDEFPDEPDESDDEELLYEPEMDDDEKINLTCQIQATLESTEEFKEYVVETDKLSEGQEFVEKLFVGQQWLSKEHCKDYLKDLALDLNHSIVQAIHGLKHPLANARWVSKVMLESFKAHPNYNPRDFMTE
ncbi:hypothetical protein MKW98_030252, partial [Papaver atlanticum]